MSSVVWFSCGIVYLIAAVTNAADDKKSFLVLGDWGGLPFHPFTSPVQTTIANTMATVAGNDGADFVVTLGDNFYLDGVTDENDPRFTVTYEDVYSQPSLQIPWYVVAGNHDYFGNVTAQIEYSKMSQRWKYPSYYHKTSASINDGPTVEVILIDTIQLCGNVVTLKQPEGPVDVDAAEEQWAWLEAELKESNAEYILVAGHYPIYSVSLHGPTDCLVDRLYPMLTKYNVNAYLAGHDHNLQHIQINGTGNHTFHQFVIGSGNFVDTDQSHKDTIPVNTSLNFFFADLMYFGGFGYLEMTKAGLNVRLIDGMGHTRYEYELLPRV